MYPCRRHAKCWPSISGPHHLLNLLLRRRTQVGGVPAKGICRMKGVKEDLRLKRVILAEGSMRERYAGPSGPCEVAGGMHGETRVKRLEYPRVVWMEISDFDVIGLTQFQTDWE